MTNNNLYKIAIYGGVCAVGAFLLMRLWYNQHSSITFMAGQQYPSPPQPFSLTDQEVADYRRDGFLLKRNLVTGDQLAASIRAGERLYHSFTIMDWLSKGVSFYAKLRVQTWRTNAELIQLAFESSFPTISAQLLNETKSIRILKDGFFGQGSKSEGCGFHVDDAFFWPASEDSTGVNFWVALSSTVAAHGGGIRVVNQSLLSPETFNFCKDVIRGKYNKSAVFNSTCTMEQLSPTCHEIMMKASVLYDMNPGDVILWDRWTFHRGEPLYNNNNNQEENDEEDQHKMRYTIRYVPSNAVADGFLHATVKQGEHFDTPLHPQVWPTYRKDEIDCIRNGSIKVEDVSFGWKMTAMMLLRKLGVVA